MQVKVFLRIELQNTQKVKSIVNSSEITFLYKLVSLYKTINLLKILPTHNSFLFETHSFQSRNRFEFLNLHVSLSMSFLFHTSFVFTSLQQAFFKISMHAHYTCMCLFAKYTLYILFAHFNLVQTMKGVENIRRELCLSFRVFHCKVSSFFVYAGNSFQFYFMLCTMQSFCE